MSADYPARFASSYWTGRPLEADALMATRYGVASGVLRGLGTRHTTARPIVEASRLIAAGKPAPAALLGALGDADRRRRIVGEHVASIVTIEIAEPGTARERACRCGADA